MDPEQIIELGDESSADRRAGGRSYRRPLVLTAVLVPAAVGVGALSYPLITGMFA